MEYSIENISPTRTKVLITVPTEEVEASIMATAAMYRTSVQLDGFRKGKAPLSVIESRFKDKIYQEAKQDLVNVHINDVLGELKATPLSGIDFDGNDFVRGEPYAYSISFEVLPTFEVPSYEGMEVEQEKAEENEAEVEEVLGRIRRNAAKLEPAEGMGPAVDGQVAELDFSAYKDGQPMEGISAQNFQLSVGEKQALEEFENLVKTAPIGQETEGEVTFPEDFIAKDVAGQTVTMKVRVHAIKDRVLPEVNDEFAKGLGFESADKLSDAIRQSSVKSRENLYKASAQKDLLDRLLKMADFPLPDATVDVCMKSLMVDMRERLERQGKSLASTGKSMEEIREELRPRAESMARSQVFLLCVAKKENIDASEDEVNQRVMRMASQQGENFRDFKDSLVRSGVIFHIRDSILADKAMDTIYDKANVTMVEAKKPEEKTEEAEKAE